MRRIIGVGSPFGADQLGWLAIDQLRELASTTCELIKLDRPGSDLLRHFEGAHEVVLIDAVQVEGTPGSVLSLQRHDLALTHCCTSSHGFGLADALEMAARLGLLPQRLLLIGIVTGADLERIPLIPKQELLALL